MLVPPGGLQLAGHQGHPVDRATIEADLEGIGAGPGEGDVEDQHSPRLQFCHTGRRLPELDRALAAKQFLILVVDEPDAYPMAPHLRAATPYPDHQVGPGVDGREARNPDVLEDAEDRQLALLVDQGIVSEDREVELQVS